MNAFYRLDKVKRDKQAKLLSFKLVFCVVVVQKSLCFASFKDARSTFCIHLFKARRANAYLVIETLHV